MRLRLNRNQIMNRLILASKSPRRSELLASLGLDFDIKVADADETLPDGIAPDAAVMHLSRIKASSVASVEARAVSNTLTDTVVIGADTIVYLPEEKLILGKPSDRDDAKRMLRMMSGRSHSVYTGVTVIANGIAKTACEKTVVTFRQLSEEEILDYVSTGESDDKAGAYGIQGLGGIFVSGIDGDYFNVTGMPKSLTHRLLLESGIDILKLNKQK